MTNQSDKQASVRSATGTSLSYEGDWHALWDMQSVPLGTFNERMLAWINQILSTSYTELNGAMAAFAIANGVSSWDQLGTFNIMPPFLPTDLPGLALWLDAADTSTITQVGGFVSQWNDKSPESNNAVQATGANQPITGTRTINGRNVIKCDGTDDYIVSPLVDIGNAANTVFAFVRADTVKDHVPIGAFPAPSVRFNNTTYHCRNGGAGDANNGTVAADTDYITGYTFSGTTMVATFLNGAPSSVSGTAVTTSFAYIGSNGASNRFFNGVIAEVIMYRRRLITSELNTVGQYLSTKWGTPWTNL